MIILHRWIIFYKKGHMYVFHVLIYLKNYKASKSLCQVVLDMEHLKKQTVAGHFPAQVFAVQVVFSQSAKRAKL